ncbi:hypothetical protein HOM50_00640 [bacterium]|jgi:hypothetical protein|nr:hypothetical protein [bacterium]MBT5014898.1 hypothetical protein [bacterium]
MAERKYFINRFPICAAFYYCVAKRLGYTESESKSLGLTRAIFFAAAKFGYIGGGKSGEKKKKKVPALKKGFTIDQLPFAGLPTYIVHEKGDKSFFGIMGDDVIKPEQYDDQVIHKFDYKQAGAYDLFIKEVEKFLKDKTDDELNSAISYDLYTEIRDKFREMGFYNALSSATDTSDK